MIYKIKYNSNRLVIIINRETAYKLQVKEEGIKLKLSLTYTYKPNRASKYIRQEVITKSIKIYIRVGLLKDL